MIKKLILTLVLIEAVLAALLLTTVSCNPQDTAEETGAAEPLITMEKGACFGTCPVYAIQIYSDGRASYQGEKYVKNVGLFQRQLPAEAITELVNAFQHAGFFSLQDEYVAEVTDLPVTWLSFRHQGQYKKIKDLIDAPPVLKELEQRVAAIAEEEGWQPAAGK